MPELLLKLSNMAVAVLVCKRKLSGEKEWKGATKTQQNSNQDDVQLLLESQIIFFLKSQIAMTAQLVLSVNDEIHAQ